ncbi:MAG: DUF4417 domain-containing protein [Clostridiales Family XIII bacterium]|jgi:hypothetical protein|nr:DUF4417 domain-containing protein [Clostridiales Family XIII bacterium]
MKTKDEHTLEPYFYNQYYLDGKYDVPMVRKQKIDLGKLKLIRFSTIVKNETRDTDATIHFFEYDDRFDGVWKNPPAYLAEIKQYRQIMTPDFSMYTDMALSLQIFNTFRNRWLGAYWQENGMSVIPTISWSNDWSYEFCFDGVEKGSCVAVSTLGCQDVKKQFMAGFAKMCERIEPQTVICYAMPFDEMRDMANVMAVPYLRNTRIAPAAIAKGYE